MCGIAGVIGGDGTPATRTVLEKMIRAVGHRGPDETAVHVDQGAGLAHARLAIIDPEGGHQPMHSDDGALTIVFNGEIFNYVELRQQLQEQGVAFHTRSDTEVALRLYEAVGVECFQRFIGQWALAIWDRPKQELVLSRDHQGILPLFYAQHGRKLLFGSEIKAILAHPDVPRKLDVRALDQIFTFWHTLGRRTAFEGIEELPPGCWLRARGGHVVLQRYWSLPLGEYDRYMSARDAVEALAELLADATRLRLRSDVPVGAYLSGGLDSSVTTALIRRHSSAPLATFSVAFEDEEFDESRYQQAMVRQLGVDHHQITCRGSDIAAVFPEVIWHTEKPVLRTAPAPLFLLSQLVREQGYKVVLTGEGSDEMLGGYDLFKEAKVRRFWARQPDSTRRPQLLGRLYPYLPELQSQPAAYLQAFFHARPQDLAHPFFSHLPRWEMTSRLKLFFSDDVRAQLGSYDACDELAQALPAGYARWHPLCQAQYLEATGLMPGYILSSQGDRMIMSHSVEGRYPFLDHRVAELAARMPPRLKIKGLCEKYVLKEAARDLVPPMIRQRSKQPYRAPDAASFFDGGRSAITPEYVMELLSPQRLAQDGLFKPQAVQRLVHKAQQGQVRGTKDNMALVGILSTQLLCDQFVRGLGRRQAYARA